MGSSFLERLSLIDASGYVIIAAEALLLVVGVLATLGIRSTYASIAAELSGRSGSQTPESPVLVRIVRDVQRAVQRGASDVNTQAIVEHAFQHELPGSLLGERFVRASTGLMIILGLVGTFYGLTLSIGKLASLVSSTDIEQSGTMVTTLAQALVDALTGMSVAFSTSLVGILSAIVMTLLGVAVNLTERRSALMVQIESYVDNTLLASLSGEARALGGGPADARLEQAMVMFGTGINELGAAVKTFQAALESFSTTTRDFREFNLHLKDNVQRMSLNFADFSESMKQHTSALRGPSGK